MKRRNFLTLCAALPMIAACQSGPAARRFPDIGFTHKAAIPLRVADITVEDRYQPPLRAPHVDHLFPQKPADVMKRWAAQRLVATGGGDLRAKLIITEASAIEDRLQLEKGLSGAFKNQQAERYTLRLAARLELVDFGGRRAGSAAAQATRSRTVAEDITLRDRESVWFGLTENAAFDFDAEMERQIRAHLGPFMA